MAVLGVTTTYAQSIFNADIRETVEIWEPFDDGFSFGDGPAPFGQISLPSDFDFRYNSGNMLVTDIYVYGNGFLSFNTMRSPSDLFIPTFAEYPNMVSWYGNNLTTNGELSYKMTGTKPFRVVTIQHTGARTFLDFSGRTIDVQVKIYETTDEIKIIYGNSAAFGGGNIDGYLYFTDRFSIGQNRYQYVNIQPNIVSMPSTLYKSNSNPNTNSFLNRTIVPFMPEGRAFTYSQRPSLAEVSPNNHLFALDDIINDDGRPFIKVNRASGQSTIKYRYRIYGPIGSPDASYIYIAVDADDNEWITPNPQPLGNGYRIDIMRANGIAAGANGVLDLRDDNILAGQYRVEAYMEDDETGQIQTSNTFFTIADANDLALTIHEEPKSFSAGTYSYGGSIPVRFQVKNQGVNPISEFLVTYSIKQGNTVLAGETDYLVTLEEPIQFRESALVNMDPFIPPSVGDYTYSASVTMTNVGGDDIPENNVFPRAGEPNHVFRVGYEIEGAVAEIINPPSTMSAKQPTVPLVRLVNNGISDMTNSTLRMVITTGNPPSQVYDESVLVEDIPAGASNTIFVDFPRSFTPQGTGSYLVTVTLSSDNDAETSNNTLSKTVNVTDGLSGTYFINNVDWTNPRTYRSITAAVEEMYLKGVSDDVTFLLQNSSYNEGNITADAGIDMSSKIVGLGEEGSNGTPNTVTFRTDESVLQGSQVSINLETGSGIGILFGNKGTHPFPDAPVNKVPISEKDEFAVSNGYIIFDGGGRKGITFSIITNSDFRSVFYLGNGASNIQLKNLMIKGGINQASNFECYIPRTQYDAIQQRFNFEKNENVNGTYTAGVIVRSVEPKHEATGTNLFNVPIDVNANNVVSGNEISGFGYGIVSLGLGAMFNAQVNDFVQYYNHGNSFTGNNIFNVSQSGIFLGFEQNTTVSMNNIYDVWGTCTDDVAGIMLGNSDNGDWLGYSNSNVEIKQNEISYVNGITNVYGIKIVQRQVELTDRDQNITYPNEDGFYISSNIVRDLKPENAATNLFGISVSPILESDPDWGNAHLAFMDSEQFISDVWIGNNTIWINSDNFENTGTIGGVQLINLDQSLFYSNAIAITDNNISPSSPIVANVLYHGVHPNTEALWSDRNVYWLSNNEIASTFRFIEVDNQSNVLEAGFENEFKRLDQWQYWTGVDNHSVIGNFTRDLELTGVNPLKLRVKTNPLPKNSVLNNRGVNEYVLFDDPNHKSYDIDGELRGKAGERFDVGAEEFNGKMSGRDLELLRVVEPGAYRATPPYDFSDAEYIMIDQAVGAQITTLIRNNSNIMVSGAEITATVQIEAPGNPGTFIDVDEYSAQVNDLMQAESKLVEFTGLDDIFQPQPYANFGDLDDNQYNIPDQFEIMYANVTPLYRIVFQLEDDENNYNNRVEKTVRFYVKRAQLDMMVSGIDLRFNDVLNNSFSTNVIAGNLNVDTVKQGLNYLGWFSYPRGESEIVDFDMFDRTVWEPRSIDYTLYRTLIWADGHDVLADNSSNVLNRYERDNILEFLNSGTVDTKKNLIIGSQEMVRNNFAAGYTDFNESILRSLYNEPGNPLGAGGNYNGETVSGVHVGRDINLTIMSTEFDGDTYPAPGLVNPAITGDAVGSSKAAYRYDTHIDDVPPIFVDENERIMGVATTSLTQNVVYFGVDWRHWADIESSLRAVLDYIVANGSPLYDEIIPVELAGFNAEQRAAKVDLSWRTASEINSSHFEIERADVAYQDHGAFSQIDQIPAAGRTVTFKYYGPISDYDVQFGNTYAYRLKMVDQDGTFEYSDVKYVTVTGSLGSINVEDPKPNPASSYSTVSYSIGADMHLNIGVYDIKGSKVMSLVDGMKQAGNHNLNLDLHDLSAGTYTLIIKAGNDVITKQINVVR